MSNDYTVEDFRDDKKNYRIMYRILSEGGTDTLYKKFIDLNDDDHTRDYWVLLIGDMLEELSGLKEAMTMVGTGDYENILEKIAG